MNRQTTIEHLIVFILLGGISWLPARGDTNPRGTTCICRFIEGGIPYKITKFIPNSYWHSTLEPWDGCFTGEGNRHDHAHPGHVYPFLYGSIVVTVAKTNAFWDAYYTSYTRISGATFSRNCHGYAIGFNGWPGMGQILIDDYTTAAVSDADIYHTSSPSHSVRIDGICVNGCNWDSIQKVTEKNGTSGVYRSEWYCPDGAGIWSNPYKKD